MCCLLLLAMITTLQFTSVPSCSLLMLSKSTEHSPLIFSSLLLLSEMLRLSINSSEPDATCILLQKWFSPRDLSTAVSQLDREARHQRKATFSPTVPFTVSLCPVTVSSLSPLNLRLKPHLVLNPVTPQFAI